MFLNLALAVPLFSAVASAAESTFIPLPDDVTHIQSENYPDSSISYKETTICETTPGVKGFSGFVTVPSFDKTYNASIFFWYFESRKNAAGAPTTIYIPGGPGESFLDGASGLPCTIASDSNSTILNPWSWNNDVNILFLDVPVQTGFSYTNAQNGTVDLLSGAFTPAPEGSERVGTNLTSVASSLSSTDSLLTINTTAQVARQIWQISQVWFQEFPERKTTNDEISFWSYSYAGFFAPAAMSYFQKQNERIDNGTISDSHAKKFPLGTLGITNGCIDSKIEVLAWPEYAYNNTYDLPIISKEIYEEAKNNVTKEGGCYDLIDQCRALQINEDPEHIGNNADVNEACVAAFGFCFDNIQGAFTASTTRSPFDISVQTGIAFPRDYPSGFFNQRWVQEALGVPVNFTLVGNTILMNLLYGTGDPVVRTVADVEYLLSAGVHLALVYGDRDYRCNWLGAERVSLAMNYSESSAFRSAGYANIETNSSYVGGMVRQNGNVSFSRVFEAGHSVTAYQPETVYRIFKRSTFGYDVATGEVEIGANNTYSSDGPSNIFDVKNKLPEALAPMCHLYQAPHSCTEEQLVALQDGTAVTEDFIVVSPASEPETTGNKTSGSGSSSTPTTATSGAIRSHCVSIYADSTTPPQAWKPK
ncbi:Alpha/Beta hydrolase protein [Dactylonectria macrodidyma]|uniref:Alpha/Beta hydrolase protein n=1 Tax=Dactylonectria macrodidyma TaxID=307937 RepID=A0A9P9J3Y8_9HYPO|nr:Alpha/Beta hydrolase protein [Dactylonectria macrodidyma]